MKDNLEYNLSTKTSKRERCYFCLNFLEDIYVSLGSKYRKELKFCNRDCRSGYIYNMMEKGRSNYPR